MAISVFLPIFYVGGLLGILYAVGRFIRSKNQPSIFGTYFLMTDNTGYFPINRPKLEYEELSEQYSPEDINGKRVLTVALVKRGMEAVVRAMRLQQEKPPLQQMVRDGSIGESLWENLVMAEAEIEEELKDVLIFLCS